MIAAIYARKSTDQHGVSDDARRVARQVVCWLVHRSRQRAWQVAGLLAFNILIALLFETRRPLDMTWDGLWTTRTGLWAGLLLLDNLVVLWWYARRTQDQYDLAVRQYREGNKPFVVTKKEDCAGGGCRYHVINIGPGLAVNVWYVEGDATQRTRVVPLGALGSGDSQLLAEPMQREYCDRAVVRWHALVAEAIYTRTARWNTTINVRLHDPGGLMRHQLADVPERDTESSQTIEAYLDRHWNEGIVRQAEAFSNQRGAILPVRER